MLELISTFFLSEMTMSIIIKIFFFLQETFSIADNQQVKVERDNKNEFWNFSLLRGISPKKYMQL